MKVSVKIERDDSINTVTVKVMSSKDPNKFYEFISFTNEACDIMEELMDEDTEGGVIEKS